MHCCELIALGGIVVSTTLWAVPFQRSKGWAPSQRMSQSTLKLLLPRAENWQPQPRLFGSENNSVCQLVAFLRSVLFVVCEQKTVYQRYVHYAIFVVRTTAAAAVPAITAVRHLHNINWLSDSDLAAFSISRLRMIDWLGFNCTFSTKQAISCP